VRACRNDPDLQLTHLPVLLASGFAIDEVIRDLGPGVAFLPKPYETEDLLAQVRALLS
jgi:DNA-binding response OmpR family regulator